MIAFLRQITSVRADYPDLSEQQQAQRLLLVNLSWVVIIVLAAPLMLWWLSGAPDTNRGLLFMPLTVIVTLVIHGAIQRGQLRIARPLFVANVLLAALLATFPDYRLDSPLIVVLSLPVTAAGVLLRRPGLFRIALLVLAAAAMGGLIQITADMGPTRLGDTTESVGTSIILILAMTSLNTIMLWTFVSSAEESLEHQHNLATLIAQTAQISGTLGELSALDETLDQTVEQLRDAFGLYHAQVFLSDPVSGLPVLQASTGYIGRRLVEAESALKLGESSPISDALRRKDPILILDSDPEDRRVAFLPATQSQLLLPLRVGNLLPFGVLDLHSTDRHTFSPEALNVLAALSYHMAAALYAIRQTDSLRTSFQERDRFAEQIDAVQREVARLNRQLVGTTWGVYLSRRQATTPGLDWVTGGVLPPETESDVIRQTIEDGQPRLEQRDEAHILCVPIRLRGQTLGAVEFRRAGSTQWTSDALELAQVVAERLALSLENVRLFEQAQTTAQREQLVSQITSQLQTSTDLQSLLTLAATQFQDALGASQTRVRLGLAAEDNQA